MQLSKTPTREELESLAALPYGKVEEALRKSGHWSDAADPEMIEYAVEATGMVEVEAWGEATVYAKTIEQAREKAKGLSAKDFEWDCDIMNASDVASWDIKAVETVDN